MTKSLPFPYILTAADRISALLKAHFFPNFHEAFYNKINVFFCMACAYLGADSRLPLWYDREREGHYIDALCHHSLCKFSSQFFIIQHNRHARVGSRNDIESVVRQLLSVVCGGFLKMIPQLRAFLQHVKQLSAGADDRRGQSVGE